jgi:hypothetical protein
VLAAESGDPVEVLPDRTDYAQTFAEPDGGFTLDESAAPVRVQQPDGSWVPVDTTLSVQPDGSVRPAAVTTGLVLSGGGSGPLYTLSQGGDSMAVSWPGGSLPVPSLSGPTATYADVLPGVNLLMTVTPTGVSELLQVTSAEAAANPALTPLAFQVAASGLSLSASASGTISAANSAGAVQYAAPPPQMWDSAGSQAPGGPTDGVSMPPADPLAGAAGPVPGDHMATVGVSLSQSSLSMSPPESLLQGSSTVYPVYIDPEVNTQAPDSWSDVAKSGDGSTWGDWEYSSSDFGGVRAGVECDPDSSGKCIDPNPDSTWVKYRSFLNFSVPSSIWDSGYVDAQLQTTMKWAWSCSPGTQVDLYYSDHADRGMTWPGPAEKWYLDDTTRAYRNGDSSCNQNSVNFDASGAAKSAANNHDGSITLELRANDYDESNWNVYSWRRFAASSMNLQINYRHAPYTPWDRATQPTFDAATGKTVPGCASSGPGDYVNSTAPQMVATDNDQDSYGKFTTEFDVTNITTGGSWEAQADEGYEPPPAFTFHSRWSGAPGNGSSFKWRAYGKTEGYYDGIGNWVPSQASSSTPWCYFTEDRNPPATPTITSVGHVYTSGTASGHVGEPGQFTFSDPGNSDPSDGVNDVVGYLYGLNNSSPDIYVPAGTDHTATVTITPFNPAEMDLYVQAVDRADNVSQDPPAEFQIITQPPNANIATLAWWKMNEGSGSTASDSTGDASDLTLGSSGATLGCGSAPPSGYRCTLALDGTAGHAFTARPVVGNNGSFSVSAWVYLNSAGSGDQAALSQAGTNVPGFTLGYDGGCGCWSFDMPASDSTSDTVYKAQSAAAAKTGTWTQLTGVFDSTRQTLALYVNGQQQGQITGVASWSAPAGGLFRLGSDGTGGPGPHFWHGQISAACAFYGALAPADVSTLYDGGSGDGCGQLAQTYP